MPDQTQTPEPAGQVSDAVRGNWVDRYAPPASRPYLRLSRADRPIGTWLLLLPCWWGLALAILHDGQPRWQDLWIFVACGAGAWLMRGAGCTWNDITDRDFDAAVERTKSRPIPSGQVSARQAAVWMLAQALIAFAILLTFNTAAIIMGVISLLPVAIYPFAKRFTWWPQVFLGLAFNWGALLVWVAHTGSLHPAAFLLYMSGIAWTLFYDTIYAHQDKEDDALIGVKSTARLFADQTPVWLRRFMVLTVGLMAMAVLSAMLGQRGQPFAILAALAGPWVMGWHMLWQLRKLNTENPEACLMLFRANRDTGLIPLLFFAGAAFL
ncbi:4-hydroxybenzoate octaprenyltransferase [Thalassovita taeanensis]|uniref:4-hydroxybenzoate octaprenyltransferase n=1 Tax=Thalassovita taeanensis TaxID=657014 RepID=A0A1H9AUQ4_9RHOB|nr:4-hydroxybenzoate octaprenyltransferase [Thalassovita taeanensis]SEP80265.1 4-hydroxybenzoate polyprenyltransferase [Thalassovita taeanensis]